MRPSVTGNPDAVAATNARSSGRDRYGFNLIGYVSSNSGLGVSARNIARMLLEKEHPLAILDTDPGLGRERHDLSLDRHFVRSPTDLPYGINLAILAVPSLPAFFLEPPTVIGGEQSAEPGYTHWLAHDRLNVAVVWWELPVLSEVEIKALQMFDLVIAPSPYIQSTMALHLSDVHTIPLVHPFSVPDGVSASRRRFGLPEDIVLFVTSFEPISDPERKNPFAAIEAFKRAFPDDSRAGLVIKLNNAHIADVAVSMSMQKLLSECRDDPRIRIIDEVLSYPDVLSLYASCDAFVSLHRSEGFGFGLAEMMSLRKPVIATAWSGNMAFMNHTNSCLVGYRLIPIRATLPVYNNRSLGRAATWADPDLEQAAAWMKELADQPDRRAAIGRKAALDMLDLQKEAQRATFIDEVRAVWENGSFLRRRSREDKLRGLHEIEQALMRQKDAAVPYGRRLHNRIRSAADKHFLWRFR